MINVRPLSQRDPEWGSELLGFNTSSQYTIGGYGCLITCLAMAANWYGRRTNPGKLNEKLKDVNGFVNGGYYVWNSLTKVYPEIEERLTYTPTPLTDVQIAEIKGWLDKGHPVMIQVDMWPETSPVEMHFVLLVGYENGWQIADPWTGNIRPLSDYLGTFAKNFEQAVEQYVGLISEPPDSFEECEYDASDIELLHEEIESLELNLAACRRGNENLLKKIQEADEKYTILEDKYLEETETLKLIRDQCLKDFKNYKSNTIETYEDYEKQLVAWKTKYNKLEEKKNQTIEDLEKRILETQKPLKEISRWKAFKYFLTGRWYV